MASETDPIAPRTWVAIDIAKGLNVALVEHADGRQQRFRFVHQRDDYDRLVAFLKDCAEPCRIALEPTADYHRTIAFRLVSEGFDLVLVSSVAGARLREAVFNSWDKNDPKDAQVIMRLLKQGMTQRYCDPVVMKTHDLQELSKTYLHISRTRTRLQHVIVTHYLTLYFPEMERFWTTQRSEWFIRLLMQFPTPASITAIGLPQFRGAIWKSMGRRVHKEAKIAEIYALAARSIALPMPDDCPAVTSFRLQLERYLRLCETRTALEVQADALLADSRLSVSKDRSRSRSGDRAGDPRRGRRSAPLLPSSAVPEVLRIGLGEVSVGRLQIAREAVQAGKRASALCLVDGCHERREDAGERIPGEIPTLRRCRARGPRSEAQGANSDYSQNGSGGLCTDQTR